MVVVYNQCIHMPREPATFWPMMLLGTGVWLIDLQFHWFLIASLKIVVMVPLCQSLIAPPASLPWLTSQMWHCGSTTSSAQSLRTHGSPSEPPGVSAWLPHCQDAWNKWPLKIILQSWEFKSMDKTMKSGIFHWSVHQIIFNIIFTDITGDYLQRNIVMACHDSLLKPESS